LDGCSSSATDFRSGSDIQIEIRYRAEESLRGLKFALGVTNARGVLFTANMLADGYSVNGISGAAALQCTFRNVPLNPGAYQVFGEVWGPQGYDIIVPWAEWARFRITDETQVPVLEEEFGVLHLHADSPIAVDYAWRIPVGCSV
jgi:hypothetical protein